MESKLQLFLETENKPKKFNLQWIVRDVLKIPKTLKSPTFTFFSEMPDGGKWNLCIDNSDSTSTSLLLHYGRIRKMNLRVEYTVTFRKPDGTSITEVNGNHVFSTNDSIVLHSKLNEIVSLGLTDTLNVEFNFIVYGVNMEMESSYYIGNDDNALDPPEIFSYINENKNLLDLKIHVGDKTFLVNKSQLRWCIPKFADEYLKDLSVEEITVEGLQPTLFNYILLHIHAGFMPNFALLLHTEQCYDFASKYYLKHLQKKCVDELEHIFNNENVVKYLNKAVRYEDEYLKKAISSFIYTNLDSIRERPEWKELVSSNPGLAEEVLHFKI